MPVRGSSCRVTGLPAGRQQRFEVTAVYRGPQGERCLGTRDRSQLYQQHPRRGRFRSGSLKPDRPHLDFDVLFSRSGEDYRALITRSPEGEGQSVIFRRLFTEDQLAELGAQGGHVPGTAYAADSLSGCPGGKECRRQAVRRCFHRASGRMLRRSRDRAEDQQADAENPVPACRLPRTPDLPWEFLYEQSQDWFLALSARTPLNPLCAAAGPAASGAGRPAAADFGHQI